MWQNIGEGSQKGKRANGKWGGKDKGITEVGKYDKKQK